MTDQTTVPESAEEEVPLSPTAGNEEMAEALRSYIINDDDVFEGGAPWLKGKTNV